MDVLDKLYILATKYLNNTEYAQLIDLLQTLNDRMDEPDESAENFTNKNIKYPYDIELILNIKLFRHNQLGERVELVQSSEVPFVKKVSIGQEPSEIINSIISTITNI